MNILILGGAGFLGNNLIRRFLQDSKTNITVVDSLDPRFKSSLENLKDILPSIRFIQGDIRDMVLMKDIVKDKDVIFNCAAQTSHILCFKEPMLDVEINCTGSLILLEAVRKYNKDALVVYVSSSTTIGKALKKIVDENHLERPLDIYSANKNAAEKYFLIYNRIYDLNTLVIRFANLYGPFGKGYPEFGFVNYFISLAEQGEEITIYGEGRQKRNVMYVEDAVEVLYRCIFHRDLIGDIYFAVHREHYSVHEIANEIVAVFGKGKIVHMDWPHIRKRIEINDVIISGAKLYYKMGWEPKYSLREGLIKTRDIIEERKYQNKKGRS